MSGQAMNTSKPEGRRNPVTNDHRAAWPEMNELKTEGQYRKEAGKDRRLPIPRMDMMTKEAIIRAVGGQEKIDEMTQEEVDDVCREQAKKTGDQIPWMDRQPIRFDGIDRFESVDKQLREENERRRKGEPICGPHGNHSAAQGVRANGRDKDVVRILDCVVDTTILVLLDVKLVVLLLFSKSPSTLRQ